jgi:hypothetical protein
MFVCRVVCIGRTLGSRIGGTSKCAFVGWFVFVGPQEVGFGGTRKCAFVGWLVSVEPQEVGFGGTGKCAFARW